MATQTLLRVRATDIELKETVVNINRVAKVTKGDVHLVLQQLLL